VTVAIGEAATRAFDPDELLDRVSSPPADVPPGEPFAAWRLRVLSPAEFAAFGGTPSRPSVAQLAYLAWLDLLAPTTHNTVPQRLELDTDGGTLVVWLDRERVLPESDPVGRQALVSLGCGLANVELGAQAFGWEAEVEILPTPAERLRPARVGVVEDRTEPVARVRFRAGGAPRGEAALRAMLTRKVVRAEFDDGVRLPEDLPASLAAIVARHAGLELHLVCDPASLLFLGKFQELADTTVVNRDRFALELGAWMLEDDASATVGMRGREFGMSPEATRRMRQGLLRLAPLLPDEIAGFAKVGNVGMRSSSAVAVVTVEDDGTAMRVAAGRAYEEMAILLEERGFRTAMHAGITEVDAPNFALRGRLRTRRRPEVVFRIGRVLRAEDGTRAHSSRPHLRDVLVGGGRTSGG
jgi:hypothetical protein